MKANSSISLLLDELVSGQAGGHHLHENLDLILTWLANPDSESAAQFRSEYLKRNISVDILRGYVFFILQQKMFSNNVSQAHEVLGLSRSATQDQAKVRYRKLMRVFHPDKAAGSVENFNSIAEKINLAYRQFLKERQKPEQVKIDSAPSSNTVYRPADIKSDKVESQLVRKVRHRFGNARQFQLLFFGAIASFCLFVVVLLYLQSGDTQQFQSYSSRAKAQELESDTDLTVSDESELVLTNQLAELDNAVDTNLDSDDKGQNDQVPEAFIQVKSITEPAMPNSSQSVTIKSEQPLPINGSLNEQQLLELEKKLKDKDSKDSRASDDQLEARLSNQLEALTDQSTEIVASIKQVNDNTSVSETIDEPAAKRQASTHDTGLVAASLTNQSTDTEKSQLSNSNVSLIAEQIAVGEVENSKLHGSTSVIIEPEKKTTQKTVPVANKQSGLTDTVVEAGIEDVVVPGAGCRI